MADPRDIARAALAEITPTHTVGGYLGSRVEAEFIESHLWASAQPGYPDWQWTVTVVTLPGDEPTVMELELLPTESSVQAPDWVPWSVRLAEYREAQRLAAAERAAAGIAEDEAELVVEFVPDDDVLEDDLDDEDVDDLDEDVNDLDDDDDDDEDDDDEDDDDADEFADRDDDLDGVTLPGEDDAGDDES